MHLTRSVDGGLNVGPNAVLGLAREKYARFSFDRRDALDIVRFPGMWRVARQHARTGLRELRNSASKRAYLGLCRRYCPELELADLTPREAGIRAQAVLRDGSFVHDFLLRSTPRTLHVVNAPSPAATSALPIGEEIARRLVVRPSAPDLAARPPRVLVSSPPRPRDLPLRLATAGAHVDRDEHTHLDTQFKVHHGHYPFPRDLMGTRSSTNGPAASATSRVPTLAPCGDPSLSAESLPSGKYTSGYIHYPTYFLGGEAFRLVADTVLGDREPIDLYREYSALWMSLALALCGLVTWRLGSAAPTSSPAR